MDAGRGEKQAIARFKGLRIHVHPKRWFEANCPQKPSAAVGLWGIMVVGDEIQLVFAQMPCPAVADVQNHGDAAPQNGSGERCCSPKERRVGSGLAMKPKIVRIERLHGRRGDADGLGLRAIAVHKCPNGEF